MASARSTRSSTQSQTAHSRSKLEATPKSSAGIRKKQQEKKNKKEPTIEPKVQPGPTLAPVQAVLRRLAKAKPSPRTRDRGVHTDPESKPYGKAAGSGSASETARPNTAAAAAPPPPRKDPKPKPYPRKRDRDVHTDSESEPYSEDADSDFDSDSNSERYTELAPEAPPKREFTISSPLVKAPIVCHHYDLPPSPSKRAQLPFLFTHGAGGTLSAPAVVNFCTGFASASAKKPLCAFQGNSNLASRVKGFEAVLTHWRDVELIDEPAEPWGTGKERPVFGGRSMGARAAVVAATRLCSTPVRDGKVERVKLVLVSYPLQGPKEVRDQILYELPDRFEVMFIVGDRDEMCPLTLLEDVRAKMRAWSRVVVVKGAGHGMDSGSEVRTREVGEETGRVAARWVNGEMEGDEGGVVYIGSED
ncbi:hypothetical protein B5807_10135 [Epicoccum nigrum]|uniref:KANL3/Tex30 alpha/beta hydrolase-like domain-containing protein n=1 Tax=Epicoccum nigrum TaxID=105696 RepID=A0A1Y2LND3_EPING|nr:hypothetical protein B5807_10135 [Epicoccum nigrum]